MNDGAKGKKRSTPQAQVRPEAAELARQLAVQQEELARRFQHPDGLANGPSNSVVNFPGGAAVEADEAAAPEEEVLEAPPPSVAHEDEPAPPTKPKPERKADLGGRRIYNRSGVRKDVSLVKTTVQISDESMAKVHAIYATEITALRKPISLSDVLREVIDIGLAHVKNNRVFDKKR
jgi:hypothetical protein